MVVPARSWNAVCGESKLGKTTMFARAYPRALWISNPRGISGMLDIGMVPVAQIDVYDLDTLRAKLIEFFGAPGATQTDIQKRRRSVVDAIVIDDANQLVERTMRAMEDTYKDKRQMFQKLASKWHSVLDLIEGIGLDLGLTLHDRPPRTDDRGFTSLGCPAMPSYSMSLELPKYMDRCYRLYGNPLRQPWPAELWTNKRAAPDWVLGERRTVTPTGIAPPNLAEILRAGGKVIPRVEAIEHIAEEWVEKISMAYAKVPVQDTQTFIAECLKGVSKLKTPKGEPLPEWGVDWIVQDALARADIRSQTSLRSLASAYGV